MKAKNFGIIIFIIGLVYMFVDGWLISWWIVPDYRSSGPDFISESSLYSSNSFFMFWALSVPLGSIITVLGLAVYARLGKSRLLMFSALSILFLAWLAFWSQSILYPALYGIGGGLILLSFSISVWSIIKVRMNSPEKLRTALDFRIAGYILLLITAWGMCGLLGIPSFGLRPEEIIKHDTQGVLITMGAKVMICFALGWIMIAVSHALEYHLIRKVPAHE